MCLLYLQPTMLQWIELLTKQFNNSQAACEVQSQLYLSSHLSVGAVSVGRSVILFTCFSSVSVVFGSDG